jgi:hypothetical protein
MHTMPVRELSDRELLNPRSRLICSNSSTLDRAIPDLHADDYDMKIRTGVGPIFVTTRCTHHQRDHHPGGARIRDLNSSERRNSGLQMRRL